MILPSNHPHQASSHNHAPILAHHLTNKIKLTGFKNTFKSQKAHVRVTKNDGILQAQDAINSVQSISKRCDDVVLDELNIHFI